MGNSKSLVDGWSQCQPLITIRFDADCSKKFTDKHVTLCEVALRFSHWIAWLLSIESSHLKTISRSFASPCFSGIFTNFSREKPAFQLIDFTWKTGAGEGIRALDPDLGKIHAGSIKIHSLTVHAAHKTPYNLLIYLNCRSHPSLDWIGENLCSPKW